MRSFRVEREVRSFWSKTSNFIRCASIICFPFIGRAHVAYIPNGKVIGLSKVARIVDVFARRLQIQENLTTQIAESLMECLEPSGVAVVVEAKHLCMMMRGVEKQNSVMKTSCLLGHKDARTRSNFSLKD